MRLFSLLIFLCSLSFSPLRADWVLPATELVPPPPVTSERDNYPEVSVNAAGNAIAVWQHRNGAAYTVRASKYDPLTRTWTATSAVTNLVSQDSTFPQIGIDSAGNAIAIWTHFDGSNYSLRAAAYNGATWSSTTLLSSNPNGQAYDYSLAVGSSGNGVAVWSFKTGSTAATIQAKAYFNGSWSTLSSPSSASGLARTPDIGVDSSGNAVAIWQVYNFGSSDFTVQAAAYTISSNTWDSTSLLTPVVVDNSQTSYPPKIGVNSAGNAVAVWQIYNGGNTNIAAATRPNSGSWSAPSNLAVSASPIPMNPQVGVDSNGNAVAAWQFYVSPSSNANIQATTYTATNDTWQSPTNITPQATSFIGEHFVQAGVSSSGSAVLAWTRVDNTTNVQIVTTQATTYDGSDWSLTTTNLGAAFDDSIPYTSRAEMDSLGNGIVVWPNNQISTPSSALIEAATYLIPPTVTTVAPTTGVTTGGTSITITGTNFTGATDVKFGSTSATSFIVNSATSITAIAPAHLAGVINITVITAGGTSAVTSADQYTYFQDAPSAPSNFSGQVRNDTFLLQTDITHVLTWTPSSDSTIVGYKIFCEGALLATIAATGPFTASIHNRVADRSYTYTLAAYNATGVLSDVLTTTVK